jgi:hypothetical protein
MGEPEQGARGNGCANETGKRAHHSPRVDELERQVAALESAIKIRQAERRAKKRVGGKFNPKNFH